MGRHLLDLAGAQDGPPPPGQAGDDVPGPDLDGPDGAEVFVRDISGRSEAIEIKGTVVSAFSGWVVLGAERADVAERMCRLLAFATYAGVGSYTARGLGAVHVRPVCGRQGAAAPA
ncbi:MAG: CRISPR system precrRNA processing endoribonuclease RAMP protein Cas6 [Kineosporiaceae bacterium]